MDQMKRNPEAVAEAIRKAGSIAVCSHVNPDGDTIGCALAMRLGLQSIGKQVAVFCADKVPDNLSFLPGAKTIRPAGPADGPFDLLLSVDVSDAERLGASRQLIDRCADFVQIDHHPTNPLFARVNSVDGEAPAACMLIYEQLRMLGIEINRDIAICLYTGISTDTGNFSFSCTNAEAFRVMGELMQYGLPLAELSGRLFRERSRAQLLLLGRAIQNLRFEGDGKIAVMQLTVRDFEECGALPEHADTLVNFGLETEGTVLALLGRSQKDGTVKFSLRSKPPYSVNDVAQQFGGGGHPQASGISMKGDLDEATERVAASLAEKLKCGETT